MLKIGPLHIPNPLVLAPMAGFTETCARRIAKRFGAGLVYSEMVSAAGLARRQPGTFDMLVFHPEEQPYGVQIFGADPAEMAEAARIAQDTGASIVDVNMGCPVKRVCRTGAGAELLRQPKRAHEIIRSVRKAITCPLTVKMRLGWDTRDLSVLEISRIAEEQGVDAITLHPRTRAQGYRGKADWSWVARLKEERRVPVIGNGDLVSPQGCMEALGQQVLRRHHDRPGRPRESVDLLPYAGSPFREGAAQSLDRAALGDDQASHGLALYTVRERTGPAKDPVSSVPIRPRIARGGPIQATARYGEQRGGTSGAAADVLHREIGPFLASSSP